MVVWSRDVIFFGKPVANRAEKFNLKYIPVLRGPLFPLTDTLLVDEEDDSANAFAAPGKNDYLLSERR